MFRPPLTHELLCFFCKSLLDDPVDRKIKTCIEPPTEKAIETFSFAKIKKQKKMIANVEQNLIEHETNKKRWQILQFPRIQRSKISDRLLLFFLSWRKLDGNVCDFGGVSSISCRTANQFHSLTSASLSNVQKNICTKGKITGRG